MRRFGFLLLISEKTSRLCRLSDAEIWQESAQLACGLP